MRERKYKLFGFEKGEGLIVLILFAVFFLMKSSSVIFNNFADTAFLKRYGIKHLPLVFLINSAIIFLFLNVLGRIIDRFKRLRFLLFILFINAGISTGLYFLIKTGNSFVYPVMVIFADQSGTLFSLGFWLLAAEVFTARQSKRLIPLLTAGGILGSMLGSFASSLFATYISIDYVIFVSIGLMGLTALVISIFSRVLTPEIKTVFKRKTKKKESGIFQIIKSSLLLRLMLLIIFVPGFLSPILNFQFSFLVNMKYTSEQSLMQFYGIFKGIFHVFLFLLHIFVTGRLFLKIGLARVLYFIPVNFIVLFSLLTARFELLIALYGKVTTKILSSAFQNPAKKALYNFFSDDIRGKVTLFMKGSVSRIGSLAGSGILILLIPVIGVEKIAFIGIIGGITALIAVRLFKSKYSSIVANSISNRQLNLDEMGKKNIVEMITPKLEKNLYDNLFSKDSSTVLLSARFFALSGETRFLKHLVDALPKVSVNNQKEFLELLSSTNDELIINGIKKIAGSFDSPLFPLYVRLIASQRTSKSESLVKQALMSSKPAVFISGLVCSINYGSFDLRKKGIDDFKRMFDNSDTISYVLGAIIRELRYKDIEFFLANRIKHPSKTIQMSIIYTLGKLRSKRSVLTIINMLKKDDLIMKGNCIKALGSIGDKRAVKHLIPYLADSRINLRKSSYNAIKKIGNDALPVLENAVNHHQIRIVRGVLELLNEFVSVKINARFLIEDNLKKAYKKVSEISIINTLKRSSSLGLLKRILEEQLECLKHIILLSLSQLKGSTKVEIIAKGLGSVDKKEASLAVEGLESLSPRKLVKPMVCLFENMDKSQLESIGNKYFDLKETSFKRILVEQLMFGGRVERSVALLVIGMYGNQSFVPLIEKVLEMQDTYLCGLAVAALLRIKTRSSLMKQGLNTIEKIFFLERVSIFKALTIRELTAIAQITEESDKKLGYEIFKEGDFGDQMYLLVSGEVEIYKNQEDGKVKLAELSTGDYFGEMALFEKKARSATAVVKKETRFLEIDGYDFEQIMREYPSIAINVCRVFSERLRETNEILMISG